MKTLSMVVPVYNTEQWLPRCLDSVLVDGALEALELILVNDGSTDASLAILRDYAARFPQTVRLIDKPNGGHGSTINAGLAAATGRYFRVLDSDDWVDTPAFLAYLKALETCEDDLVVTPYSMELVFEGSRRFFDYDWLPHNRSIPASELRYDGREQYFTIHSATFRTELLRRAELKLFEKCFYVDMQYLYCPIPLVKSLRVLDDRVYCYFIGRPEQSMSRESLLRNFPQHQRVLAWLIGYYGAWRDRVPDNIRDYMARVAQLMFYTQLDLITKHPDRGQACESLKALDALMLSEAPDLYRRMAVYPYLRLSRRLRYFNVRYFNRPTLALLGLARRLKRALRPA